MNSSEHGEAHDTFVTAATFEQQGDFESARGAYICCMSLRDPEWSPRAAYTLGESLFRRDELEPARRALEDADEPSHPVWSARAKVILGAVCARIGDLHAAEQALRAAIASGQSDCVPIGWFNLGTLYQQARTYELALEAYERALATKDVEFAPRAAVNIGFILFNYLWDPVGAERALQIAIASGHPEQAALAAHNLAALRAVQTRGGPPRHDVFEGQGDVTDGRRPYHFRFWKRK